MYRTRDWRRSQKRRIIKRVYNYERLNCSDYDLPNPLQTWSVWRDKHGKKKNIESWSDVFERRRAVAKCRAENRSPCSGPCCGNPRKWFGDLTMQEQRDKLTCKEIFE